MKNHQRMSRLMGAVSGVLLMLVAWSAAAAGEGFEPVKVGGAPRGCTEKMILKTETLASDKQKKSSLKSERDGKSDTASVFSEVETCEMVLE